MRKIILLTLTICFVLTLGAYGQRDETLAEAVEWTSGSVCGVGGVGTTVAISGRVMRRDFADNETLVSGFVLRDKKDRRFYINVDIDYVADKFSGNTVDSLSEATMKGVMLRVEADLCGKIYTLRRLTILKP